MNNAPTMTAVRSELEAGDWANALKGKTIRGVRPTHDNGPVPDVNLLFTDDTAATVSILDEVYFESCLINTLRKSQPITDVNVTSQADGTHVIELRSRTFPLLVLRAINKGRPLEDFPFRMTWKNGA